MKGIWIAVLPMLMGTGCASRQWQAQLWQNQEGTAETPKISRLEAESLDFNILVTRFRKVSSSQSFIGVSISGRNQTSGAITLEYNPIQIVYATQMLVKGLPLDQVMYKLYGGKLR